MYIHKEGYIITCISTIVTILLIAGLFISTIPISVALIFSFLLFVFNLVVISFFRIPKRTFGYNENHIMASADGTIVVIEEVMEKEFLHARCRQVSIFMSPANVHVNRYPLSGNVVSTQYHKGQYLVASNPKASELNERMSICLETKEGTRILIRQIAGALARRIVCYSKTGQVVKQNEELGFIKFGSRVDLFIPLSSKIHVVLGQKVKNGITSIAELQ